MTAGHIRLSVWTVVICGLLFGLVTWNVVAGAGLASIDDEVERALVDHRIGWVTTALKVLTWLGSVVVLWPVVGITALLLILTARRWRDAGVLVMALGGSILLTDLVKPLVDRPRPPASFRLVQVTGLAYPSGHSMDAMAVFAALALVLGAGQSPGVLGMLTGLAASAILVVGWSRLYLGVHWPTDVLGAYVLAGAWVALVAAVLLRRPAVPARSEPYPPGRGP